MTYSKRILVYLALLPMSFIGFAITWALFAPTCLYYCWDDAPPFAVSWHPPFIHPWADSLDGKLHDFYRVPEWAVYAVWILFIAGVFIVPALIVWMVVRKGKPSPNTAPEPTPHSHVSLASEPSDFTEPPVAVAQLLVVRRH